MTTQTRTTQTLNTIFGLILVIIAILGIPQFLASSSEPRMIFGITILVITYVFILWIKQDSMLTSDGITKLPLIIGWSLFNLQVATSIAILGIVLSGILGLWLKRDKDDSNSWQSFLPILADDAITLISIQLIYMAFQGVLPHIDEVGIYETTNALVASLILGVILSALFRTTLNGVTLDTILHNLDEHVLPEVFIILMGIILPLLFVQLGVITFLVTLTIITLQIYRQVQLNEKIAERDARVEEMVTLSHLSSTIVSHLSLAGTVNSIYQELNKTLSATTTYLALYNEDYDTLDYQLVIVDGKHQARVKEKLTSGLSEYVIRNKEAICYTKQEIRRLFKNLYDVSDLDQEQYMLAPLKLGNKIIGLLGVSHDTQANAFNGHDFTLFQAIASQASLALRNGILYDRTVRLADNLSIINQSIQDVMFNLDRQDALKAACQIAANVTRTSKAAIFLLDKDATGVMTRIESVGFDHLDFAETMSYHPRQLMTGTQVINNVAESNDLTIQKQAEEGQFQACVQIPLRSGNAVIGTLNVYHDQAHFYETPELNLLAMLTNQITAALDNADLLQALELYAAEQAQLVHLSRISSETLDLERIIMGVCQMLAQMMAVTRVAIAIRQAERETLRIESGDGTSFGLNTHEVVLKDVPEIEAVIDPNSLSSLRVYNREENADHSDGLKRYMQDQGDKTLALLPMRIENKTIGLVVLGHIQERNFSDNDMRLLEMANNQITVQIQNALVHTRTQQQLANRLEQLELIEDISKQISEAMELDLIIQNVLEAALQSTQADFASMAMVDPSKPATFDIVWREVVDNRLIPNRIQFEETGGVIGHVSKTGEMLILADNAQFEDYISPIQDRLAYKSSVAIPMKTGSAVIGVLNLESTQLDFFTSEQALFLNSLAGHAAISIDNANLLIEREQQIQTLTLLRELSLDALSFIERDEIYGAVIRTALILLNGTETHLYQVNPLENSIDLLKAVRSHDGQMVEASSILANDMLQQAMKQEAIHLIPDIEVEDAFNNQGVDYKSLIIIPVIRRHKIRELLCITFEQQRNFSHYDLDIVDSLAIQAAGHLENASLNEVITTNNDRMRAILDSTRDGIILLNNQGRIQDTNTAANHLIDIDLSNYLFKPLSEIATASHLSEQSLDIWTRLSKIYQEDPQAIHNQEYEIYHQDDSIVFIKILVQSVVGETHETVGHLLILRDITEEKNLQQFQVMMQSMVLHDLRGPLTSMVTSMYVAENILELYDGLDFDDLKTNLLKTFSVSLVSAEDMLRQVDTLRDLPMLSKMEAKPQQLPMLEIAEGAFNALSANYQESDIHVELAIPADVQVFVDESLIRRVIINLMHNAFKFTPENGKVLVQVNSQEFKPDTVRIDIADTGPGIPEVERERIFGQYIQIEGNKPRTGGKGTGLGLNFCKLAVEVHGGEIWVASDGPLSGACFSFIVPTVEWRSPENLSESSENTISLNNA